MGRIHEEITPALAEWIGAQHLFFVASAPRADHGHVNLSPKGLDALRILGPRRVAYLDLTGSGAETIAHLRENGRIVLMFCAFEGPPKILRLHGRGTVVLPGMPGWDGLRPRFPALPGARSVIVVDIARISDSCGYGVPLYEYRGERPTLPEWADRKGSAGLAEYQRSNNARSIDALPAIDPS